MLKNVPPLLTPELLRDLAAMGHGDRLAVVDRNYPSTSACERIHHLPGADTGAAVEAILALFPVDDVDPPAVQGMVPTGDPVARSSSHAVVAAALEAAEGRAVRVAPLERFAFYEAARSSYAIVQTGETIGYSCFLLTKGVIR